MTWSSSIKPICPKDFTSHVGPTVNVPGSPFEIFRLFFTLKILQHIVDQTNKYAFQCIGSPAFLSWDILTVEELQAYMGFLILMGLAHLPSLSDYWSKDNIFHYSAIASRITRTRFLEISKYLHFADNQLLAPTGTLGYDELGKIRPVLESLENRFRTIYHLHKEVSIDEAMIKFKGRSSMKQYHPMKPIKRGLKVWVLADSHNGYVSCLQLYTRRDGQRSDDELGGSVVRTLCDHLKEK